MKIAKNVFFILILGIIVYNLLWPYLGYKSEVELEIQSDSQLYVETEGFIKTRDGYYTNAQKSDLYFNFVGSYDEVIVSANGVDRTGLNFDIEYYANNVNIVSDYQGKSEHELVDSNNIHFYLPSGITGENYLRICVENPQKKELIISKITLIRHKKVFSLNHFIRTVFFMLIFVIMWLFYCNIIEKKNQNIVYKYLYVLICLTIMYYLLCFLSSGDMLNTFYYADKEDSFNDFFNSIADALNGNPYDKYSNYPPLALLIFKIYSMIIPSSMSLVSLTGNYLRGLQAANISFIIFLLVVIFTFIKILKFELKDFDHLEYFYLFFLISAPMTYALERGNIIIYAFIFSYLFVMFYNSDSRVKRELAYISLGIAFAIKVYPAIYGLLLLREKKWKEAIRTFIYGIVCFIVPFYYYGGINEIENFVKGLLISSNNVYGTGDNVSFNNIFNTFMLATGFNVSDRFILIIMIVVVTLLIIIALFVNDRQIALISITLLAVLVPSFSYYYVMIFFFIPFISFLKDIINKRINSKCLLYAYASILVPLGLPIISKLSAGFKTYTSWGDIIEYTGIVAMFFICVFSFFGQNTTKAQNVEK